MNVYFAILTVIFGPLIFMAFLRWLSKRVRRHVAKAEILSPDEWLESMDSNGRARPSGRCRNGRQANTGRTKFAQRL